MPTWPGPATPKLEGYLVAIRDEMVRRFEITVAEAEGRISRHFARLDLLGAGTETAIAHEGPEYWGEVGVLRQRRPLDVPCERQTPRPPSLALTG